MRWFFRPGTAELSAFIQQDCNKKHSPQNPDCYDQFSEPREQRHRRQCVFNQLSGKIFREQRRDFNGYFRQVGCRGTAGIHKIIAQVIRAGQQPDIAHIVPGSAAMEVAIDNTQDNQRFFINRFCSQERTGKDNISSSFHPDRGNIGSQAAAQHNRHKAQTEKQAPAKANSKIHYVLSIRQSYHRDPLPRQLRFFRKSRRRGRKCSSV